MKILGYEIVDEITYEQLKADAELANNYKGVIEALRKDDAKMSNRLREVQSKLSELHIKNSELIKSNKYNTGVIMDKVKRISELETELKSFIPVPTQPNKVSTTKVLKPKSKSNRRNKSKTKTSK